MPVITVSEGSIYVPAGDANGLSAAIRAANEAGKLDTIVLEGGTYTLNAPVDAGGADGPTGLPPITSKVTLIGNGAVIERAEGADKFRVLQVAAGGELAVSGLTIRGGDLAEGYGGGGIFNRGVLKVEGCTLRGNGSTALYNHGGTMVVVNSTISGNRGVLGGGIFNRNPDETSEGEGVRVINTTISANQAGAGGGIYNFIGEVRLVNTIVAGNEDESGRGDCAGNAVLSEGHNLDGDGSCGLEAEGDLSGADPRLGPLGDNGGLTETLALEVGSPAVDAGDDSACPAVDQRGVARPAGEGCDMGAFELEAGE